MQLYLESTPNPGPQTLLATPSPPAPLFCPLPSFLWPRALRKTPTPAHRCAHVTLPSARVWRAPGRGPEWARSSLSPS